MLGIFYNNVLDISFMFMEGCTGYYIGAPCVENISRNRDEGMIGPKGLAGWYD